MKYLALAVGAIALILVGAAGGFYFAEKAFNAVADVSYGVALSASGSRVAAAKDSKDLHEYEEALWAHLATLKASRPGPSPRMPEWVLANDMALTYVRLSNIASQTGSEERAAWLLSRAMALCPNAKLSDCSEESLMKLAGST